MRRVRSRRWPSGTLESTGYLSAGYDGNDANRIQPARRAAGWWRLWAESNGVPFADGAARTTWSARDEVSTRTRLWTDAKLAATRSTSCPTAFAGGTLEGRRRLPRPTPTSS